jgi:EmrB/QacA subfamily drug resistance transporter
MTRSDSARSTSPWVALLVLCAGFLMIILDQTIVNVALPSIQEDLGFSQTSLAWVVNAYLIAFGGLLLLAGRLGDLIGRKRVFLTGLVLFVLASLWCGFATSQQMLIVARFAQGVAGALTSSVILGMVVTLFTDSHGQAKAIGIYSFVGAAGASTGLLLGGVLTQALSWHWIFFVNVPIGVLVLVLGVRVLETDRGIGLRQGADVLGAALVTAALMLGTYAILTATDYGLGSGHTLGFGLVAVVLLAGFIARQARVATPLMPLRLFRSRNLSGGNLVLGLMLAGMFSHLFLGSLYLQRVLGYSPLEIGLAFLPVAVTIGGLSVGLSARLNGRFGERAVLLPSLLFIAAGLALLGRAPVGASYVADVLPAFLCLGIGGGLAFPALVTLAMSGATPSDSGLASGINNTTQQVGGALGLAVLATLASSRTDDLLAQGLHEVAALDGGYDLGFATAAGIVLAAAALALLILRPKEQAAPEEAPVAAEPQGAPVAAAQGNAGESEETR